MSVEHLVILTLALALVVSIVLNIVQWHDFGLAIDDLKEQLAISRAR